MGIQGERIVFDQAITALNKADAALHAHSQSFGLPFPLLDNRVSEFMALDPGAYRVKTVGQLDLEG